MDQETRELLRKNLELAKENNRLLRKMRRGAILGNIVHVIWWAIVVGIPVFLYFTVLQPYIDQLLETYRGLQSGVENLQDIGNQIPSIPSLKEILQKFGIGG